MVAFYCLFLRHTLRLIVKFRLKLRTPPVSGSDFCLCLPPPSCAGVCCLHTPSCLLAVPSLGNLVPLLETIYLERQRDPACSAWRCKAKPLWSDGLQHRDLQHPEPQTSLCFKHIAGNAMAFSILWGLKCRECTRRGLNNVLFAPLSTHKNVFVNKTFPIICVVAAKPLRSACQKSYSIN